MLLNCVRPPFVVAGETDIFFIFFDKRNSQNRFFLSMKDAQSQSFRHLVAAFSLC